ncbi:MAG TPA: hypothetical protein PLF16_00355, partial [Candidatus Staskawiczbacteria bacterium]|nr:hypothetical protein [Candidatus Staskawiczbacteria bacterium]
LYGTMDLKTFSEKNISNATFQQDKPFGYIINVDFTNGAVSISENYSQWPQDESISENFELIDNSETISIADKFLKDHKISVDNYGKAKIMESGQQKIVQIVYPLIVNGRNVYNPDGTDIGIFVSVDMEHKMVSSLYGLGTQKYQASSYPVVQGKKNILSMVESEYSSNNSDCRPSDADMEKQKRLNGISKIYLSTPEAAYVQISRNDSGSYGEFLVPAFAFPIKNPIDSREKIIVPLVKGLDL